MATSEGPAPAREAMGPIALKKGQGFYAQEDYEAAVKFFKKAINHCSCQSRGGMKLDMNQDILTGIENDRLKEVLSSLTPRSIRCDKQVHIHALDSLIAAYEMLSKLDKCFELAVAMVNLAPREPRVYLRLGKILRLKSNQTLAYYAYKQGIELVEKKQPHHSLLPKLRIQRDKLSALAAFDPAKKLPAELLRMTFELLDFKTLCRCLRVSKSWNEMLTKSDAFRPLWRIQTYKITQRTQPGVRRIIHSFKAYNKYSHNSLSELSIDGLSHFLLRCTFSQVLGLSQQLRVLKLREPQGSFELDTLPLNFKLPRLTTLSLGYGVQPQPRVLERLINASAGTLEELSVFELPVVGPNQVLWYPGWEKLEKLRVVRLAYPKHTYPLPNLHEFMKLAPNVEDVWLDNATYSPHLLMTRWPKLRKIFIGNNARSDLTVSEHSTVDTVDTESNHNGINELHLEGESLQDRIALSRLHGLNQLERLSILTWESLTDLEFETVVRPGMESGTLQELDIRPWPMSLLFGNPTPSGIFPRTDAPEWLKSENITYLSLTGFTALNISQTRQCDEALLALVSRFPNLHSIDISSEQFSDALLAKFIQRGVKTIYHRARQSKADLQEWAATHHDAQVISRPPSHLPSMHPDRLPFFNDHLQFSSSAQSDSPS
ncbi:hypothetical protein F5Y11DRAFT_308991 [Daldinia sp. FL1419]|nr:hypothetical protein F5Y11DRAFT_308991 [Daldinia sp. FL1419]